MSEGSIRKKSKSSHEISWEEGRDATGKRVRRYQNIKGPRKNAEARLRQILSGRDRGEYVEPTKMTFGELLEQWLDGYVAQNLRPSVQDSYRSQVKNRIAPALGGIPLSKLTPLQIQAFIDRVFARGRLDGKGALKRRTPELLLKIIQGALHYAMRMELLTRNAAKSVVLPPTEPGTFNIMEVRDIPAFIRAARETDYFLVYLLALFAGTRLGETLAPRWNDLKNGMTQLSVVRSLYKRGGVCEFLETKTKYGRRLVALPPVLVGLLKQHRVHREAERALLGLTLKEDDLIFVRYDGTPFDPSTVNHTFGKTLERAGLPHIRFHDLRHSHATHLLAAGVHPKIVQERLGHSSIAVTIDTYSHVVPGLQEMAAQRIEAIIGEEAMEELRTINVEKSVSIVPVVGQAQHVGKMLVNLSRKLDIIRDIEREPHRNRTCNLLIKSQLLCQLS